MTLAQTMLERLKEHLALPWPKNVSPRERVVMVVYSPNDERKLRRLIISGEFAREILTTGHGWVEHPPVGRHGGRVAARGRLGGGVAGRH